MKRTMKIDMSEYKPTDCGRYGKALERALTCKGYVKRQGAVDLWLKVDGKYRRCEIKTSAGELWTEGVENTMTRCEFVIYVPIPVEDKNGYIDAYMQDGYLLTKADFLDGLEEARAIRYGKSSTSGQTKVAIQTFWSRKKWKPNGTLLYRIEDNLEARKMCSLIEYLEGAHN